ncbi:MAG TPA: hypothetical protein VEP67_10670 [Thiobacillaceae bacterium]|nr:hypothetical protein [Thiobacillaceae bacterium]
MHKDHLNLATIEPSMAGRAGGSTTARLVGAVLRYGLPLLLLAPNAMAIPTSAAEAGAGQIACPALLLEHECRAYQAALSSASSADARDALKARYESLLFERQRACYCNPQRSWIRLTGTPLFPQTIFSAQ